MMPCTAGRGAVIRSEGGLRFVDSPTPGRRYTNAQLDDYAHLPRSRFPWSPPVALTVRARFSHDAGALRGTAGFGFWNDPFAMAGPRRWSLPRAIWFFFASRPSDMALALDVPGAGWKAATLDAWRWPFLALAPTAPVGFLLMRRRWLYRRLWPVAQAAMGVSERLLQVDMTQWHTYRIEWGVRQARFLVDGIPVLADACSPGGRLGCVLWIDNQSMVVTPQGRLRHGLLATTEQQWMEVSDLEIGIESSRFHT